MTRVSGSRARIKTNHLNYACHVIYSIGMCQVILFIRQAYFALGMTFKCIQFLPNLKKKKKLDTGKNKQKLKY